MIFGIWHNEDFPIAGNYLESWRLHNPKEECKIFTFAELEAVMREHYPDLLEYYDSCPWLVQKANLLRLVAIHHFGGLYLDLDMQCLRPFGHYLEFELLLGWYGDSQKMICNAILGAREPGHPFWKRCMTLAQEMPIARKPSDAIMAHLMTKWAKDEGLLHYAQPRKVFFGRIGDGHETITHHLSSKPRWMTNPKV